MDKILNLSFIALGGLFLFFLGMMVQPMFLSQSPITSYATYERHSPGDWISEDQFVIESDGLKLKIDDYILAKFTDTNSMDPFLDQGSNAIEIKPKRESDLSIGDIVSYRIDGKGTPIIHRIIDTGYDQDGKFFIMKGDNNPSVDPHSVRFSDIEYVLVGIIY